MKEILTKRCVKCEQDKILLEFGTDKRKKDIFKTICKMCIDQSDKDKKKQYYENNKENIKEKNKQYRDNNKEKVKKSKEKYYENNKEDIFKKNKQYYKDNKESVKKKNKEYRINNKEALKETRRIYKENNKEGVRTINNNYVKRKLKKDPIFKLKFNFSRSIRSALKTRGFSKKYSFLKYINYSLEELKRHIESLFEDWMTWENHGVYNSKTWNDNDITTWTWQIDHIIPHSTFKYISMEDEEFKKCWALENLRPYSAKQNVLDGTSGIRHK